MEYVVYYTCPHCRKPCGDRLEEANEMVEAQNKGEAYKFFQANKPCRWMRVSRIVKYEDTQPTRYKVTYEYLNDAGKWTPAEVNAEYGLSFGKAIDVSVQIAAGSARDIRHIEVVPI